MNYYCKCPCCGLTKPKPPPQAIVIVGTMFGAKSVHGPFDNEAIAQSWAQNNAADPQHYEVVPLRNPRTQAVGP